MAALTHDVPREAVMQAIGKLIDNLVNLKDESGEFLLRLADGRVIDTKGWNDWEWTHGIGLFGMYRYYEQTNDARALQVMLQWFTDRFEAGTPTKNINTMSPFLTLAYLFEDTGDQSYLPYLDSWAEWLMDPDGLPKTEDGGFQHIVFNDENPGELWDDTLMMSVLPLAKAAHAVPFQRCSAPPIPPAHTSVGLAPHTANCVAETALVDVDHAVPL